MIFNSSQDGTEMTGSVFIISSLFLCLCCIVTVFFNLTLFICVLKNRRKAWFRNANQLIYLILSDLIVGVILAPRTALNFLDTGPQPYGTCAAWSYILVSSSAVSYYHILAVCIHRYRMVRNIHKPFVTDNYKYSIESFVIWMTVILIFVPPYVLWGRHGEYILECRLELLFGPSGKRGVVYILVLFFIPWIGTNVIYLIFTIKVWKSLNAVFPAINRSPLSRDNSDIRRKRDLLKSSYNLVSHKKILRTVGYLLLVFNISIIAIIFLFTFLLVKNRPVLPGAIMVITLVNNFCNPVIYTSANSTLKAEVKKFIILLFNGLKDKLKCTYHVHSVETISYHRRCNVITIK